MRTIGVEHGELLHSSASEIEFAYFPRSCIISVLADTDQGAKVETSIVGREGMIGLSTITASQLVCRLDRSGRRRSREIPAAEIHRAGRESDSFRKTVALFDLSLLAQSQQSTACQALHQVENRAARWLLQCPRRLGGDDIRLTQGVFGQILGVQLTTINLVQRTLGIASPCVQRSGRGRISSSTPRDCRTFSCDCYDPSERRYEEL